MNKMKRFNMNFKWLAAALLLCAPTFAFADTPLSLDNLGVWSSEDGGTYDNETHTLKFVKGYDGANWWFGSVDYSEYAGVQVVFKTKETYTLTLYVQYADTEDTTSTVNCSGNEDDEQTIYTEFDATYSNAVSQICIQCGGYYDGGTDITGETSIQLVSATLISKSSSGDTGEDTYDYLVLTGDNTTKWSNDDSIEANEDGSATLTFTGSWDGLGWADWSSGWDLSDYDAVVLAYENLQSTDNAGIQLDLEDSEGYTVSSSISYEASGTITIVLAENTTGSKWDSETKSNVEGTIDYEKIRQIVVANTGPLTVKITSIAFVKYASGESGEKTNPYISIGEDGNTYLNFTNSYEYWTADGEEQNTITVSSESVPNTAEIEFHGAWSGAGWKYNNLDISDYYQIVIHYNAAATEETDQESLKVSLIMYSNNNGSANVYDNQNTGTLRYTIKNSTGNFDPSDISEFIFQPSVSCTVNITSIQLLTLVDAETDDEDLAYSKFYMWENSTGTKEKDGYNSEEPDTDCAPFKISGAGKWDGGCWWFGNIDEDQYWGIEIKVTTSVTTQVRLAIQYYVEGEAVDYTEKYTADCEANTEQILILPFLSSYDHYVDEVFIQVCNFDDETCDITVNSAKLIGRKNTGYPSDYDVITTVNTESYATYYNSETAYRIPLGMKGTAIYAIDLSGEETGDKYELTTDYSYNLCTEVNAGDVVPAGVPLLLKGTEDADAYVTFTAFYTDEEGETPEKNWLHGSDTPITADDMTSITKKDNEEIDEEGTDYYYFKLSYRSESDDTIGFYYGDNEGAAFDMPNSYHRAWLAIPQDVMAKLNESSEADGTKLTGFSIGGGNSEGDQTTGITAVPTVVNPDAIYTLQGVRVNDMNRPGIYIVGGKKVVKQ